MRVKLTLMFVVMCLIVTTLVGAQPVPDSVWKLPLVVRQGVDDLKATVGEVFKDKTFKSYVNADGANISAGYGKFKYDEKTLTIPVMILNDNKPEATFTFSINNEGSYAYLTEVLVRNDQTTTDMSLETFEEKMQGIMLFEQLVK